MKFSTLASSIVTLTGVSARLALTEAQALCGDLDVLSAENVPPGTDLEKARTCLNHPLGQHTPTEGFSKPQPKVCDIFKPFGCSRGYCWKTCDQGTKFCWVAQGDGTGPWITCSADNQCNASMACGVGDCEACGCKC